MKITKNILLYHNVNQTYLKYFMDRFPEKKVNYRDLLRVVTEDENIGFARWLVGTFFNPFDELVESNVHCKHIFFPGSVCVTVILWRRGRSLLALAFILEVT